MAAFFCMGFVDMAGTVTNFVKADFGLSDTMANFLPSMVFLWFFFLAVPVSMLMDRIGKKKTVLASLAVTLAALLLPLAGYSYPIMLVSLCLLGIGNALMQVSLNPLISCIVSAEKLPGTMSFGQFVKAIASFSAPLAAAWCSVRLGDWRYIYIAFAIIDILTLGYLFITGFEEAPATAGNSAGFMESLGLLKSGTVAMLFVGIVCHVGIDVGINTAAPKILMERTGLPLPEAAVATSIYFIFRTIGCLSGAAILSRWKMRNFFMLSAMLMVISMAGLFLLHSAAGIHAAVAFAGFGNSNVFSMIFSRAMLLMPEKKNAMSGLMIMGLIGGTLFPLLMGVLSDAIGSQTGSILVISAGVAYLAVASLVKSEQNC